MEPEMSSKMLGNLVEKLRAKLHATICGYSMVKFSRLDVFSQFVELYASPVEGQSLQQKDKKRRQRKGAKRTFRKVKSLKRKVTSTENFSKF